MSSFQDVAGNYRITDSVFADAELQAYDDEDEAAFDRAGQARKDNDELYFLYLFTRFECEVSAAFEAIAAVEL